MPVNPATPAEGSDQGSAGALGRRQPDDRPAGPAGLGALLQLVVQADVLYAVLLDKLGLSPDDLPDRDDKANWPRLKKLFAGIFATRTRDEWAEIFAGCDACCAASALTNAGGPLRGAGGGFGRALSGYRPSHLASFSLLGLWVPG